VHFAAASRRVGVLLALALILPCVSPAQLRRKWTDAFVSVVRDHGAIWTSPFRMQRPDLGWLAPLGLAVAAIPHDLRINGSLPNTPDQIRFAKGVSHLGDHRLLAGAAGAFFLAGKLTRNHRARETGLIAAQAMLHSHAVGQLLKFAAGRERPDSGPGRGRFFNGEQSFPSGHAASTWAVATVISNEYRHRKLIRDGVYALPVIVSAARLGAQRHFASDLLAGGAMGHLIGRFLYHRHHAGRAAPRWSPVAGYDARWRVFRFGVAVTP
jgi:membrane-associated phospholipid phosphatase